MKIEIVITVWDDGLFKSRDRIESDNYEDAVTQVQIALDMAEKRLAGEELARKQQLEDDDIPF